jgi:hypothetical protein
MALSGLKRRHRGVERFAVLLRFDTRMPGFGFSSVREPAGKAARLGDRRLVTLGNPLALHRTTLQLSLTIGGTGGAKEVIRSEPRTEDVLRSSAACAGDSDGERPLTVIELHDYLAALRDWLEALTGLRSRWNGTLIVSDEVDEFGRPRYSAEKVWTCEIAVHRSSLRSPSLFISLVHESFHAISAGVTQRHFQLNRGFEEGVVEWLTRHLVPRLAEECGTQAVMEGRAAFQRYLESLERLRNWTGKEDEVFYLDLLRTPLAQRSDAVVQWAMEAHPEESRARMLARLSSDLRGLR